MLRRVAGRLGEWRAFASSSARRAQLIILTFALVALPRAAFAQSPWERAASNLERTFTGPLARSAQSHVTRMAASPPQLRPGG